MQFDTDKPLRGYQEDPYRQRNISRQSQEPQNQEDFFKQFENYKSNIESAGMNPQMNLQKGPTNDFNAFPPGKKDQLFVNPNANTNNLANPSTETERDRRLRLRSEERKRRNTGQAASVYEQPQIQESLDKPPEMWDFQPRQADLKMLYEVQNTENLNRGYQNKEKMPQTYEQPSPDIKAKPVSIPATTNSDESASLKYQKQQQYKAYLDEQVSNSQNKGRALSQQRVDTGATVDSYNDSKEQEARKKRQYALELQAQIEQKNKALVSQEIREEVGQFQNPADLEREKKRKYAQELQAQMQAQALAKNNQKRNFSDENNYDANLPGNSQQDLERERKKRYAQELQAQIQAKEAQKGYRRSTTQDARNSQEQELVPQQTPQDIERERKKQYAQELQAQIQAKQSKSTEKKYENYNYEALPPKGNDEAALKKKLYAQELQAQIQLKQALQGDKNKRSSSMERPSSEQYYQQKQEIYQPRQENLYRQENQYQPRDNFYQPRQENVYQPRQDEQFSSFDQRSFNPDYEKMMNPPDQFQSFQPSYDKFQPSLERGQSLPTQPDYPSYQPPQSYNSQQEIPLTRENSITKPNLPPQDKEKINRYRQELEIQIEEAKKRKEEEKRKQKEDDERHEKKFFMEAPNENKPLIMKKIDPNRPSEDHPQAQRYQELMEKAKVQAKESSEDFPDTKQNYKFQQEDSKADFNRPSKLSEPSGIDNSFPPTKPNYKFQQKQDDFNQGNFPPTNPSLNFPPANPQLNFPSNPQLNFPPTNQQFNFPDTQLPSPGNFQKNLAYDPRNAYLKEMQEIRMEREKARDQMLEMREMMLKEREKQLESMLLMLKIQPPVYGFPPQQTRPVSYGSNMQMEPNEFPQYNLPNPQYPPGSRQYSNNPSPLMTETSNPYEIPQPNTNFNQKPYDLGSPPANYSQPNYEFPVPKINKDTKQALFGQPQNSNLVDLQSEQNARQPGYADLLTTNPQSEDLFEKSLMSSQKWVDPHLMKWGDVKIADSSQFSVENPSPERKKWSSPKKNLDVEVKNYETLKTDSQDTPKFQLKTIPEENPSLFQANEVDEHIEEEINENYPTQEDEEKEIENPSSDSHKEITLSQPKYEESADLQFAADSLRGSEDSINMQSASIGSNYSQEVKVTPKAEIAFNFKESTEETSTDIINNFLQGPKQRQIIGKPEGPKKSLAISRLDEARMYAKQHKAEGIKDIFEELDTKLMEELSKPKFTPKYEDSLEKPAKEVGFSGKFTKVALNELRKQKYQNSIDNILQDSRPSSKSSTRQAVDDFLSKFEKESSPHKSSSRQSRRYENQNPII